MAAKPTWLDRQVGIVLDELASFGLTIDRKWLAVLISDRVSAVASHMGVTATTARRSFTEDLLRGLAQELAVSLAEEQPGADILKEPRTIPLQLATLGRTMAALAEAGQIRVGDADEVGARLALQVISALGQVVAEADLAAPEFSFPQALLARGARVLEATADQLRGRGSSDHNELSAERLKRLADAFARDAAELRSLVARFGRASGPVDG